MGAGASPLAAGAGGKSALSHAAASGSAACVQLLLNAGAPAAQRDDQGLTPLMHAADTGANGVAAVRSLAAEEASLFLTDNAVRALPACFMPPLSACSLPPSLPRSLARSLPPSLPRSRARAPLRFAPWCTMSRHISRVPATARSSRAPLLSLPWLTRSPPFPWRGRASRC